MHNIIFISEETLQIDEKRREAKGKREKESYIHLNAEFQRIRMRDNKAFLKWAMQGNRGKERLEISSRKLEISREHFMETLPQWKKEMAKTSQKQKILRRGHKNI